MREIEDIAGRGIRAILFRDACFTFDRKRCVEICEAMIEKFPGLAWWCETRVDCLDPELMALMKRAGCRGMNIGVETGDRELAETRTKIGLTLPRLSKIRDAARAEGLKLHFLLMIGFPGETRDSLYRTYGLVRDLRPESAGVCIVTPYPGTPLYLEAEEKGWIESRDWSLYGGHSAVMHTDTLSIGDIREASQKFRELFDILKLGAAGMPRRFIAEMRFRKWAQRRP
jgi:radical SAM superfamily enzyme YgiQ (UPF0313 family)